MVSALEQASLISSQELGVCVGPHESAWRGLELTIERKGFAEPREKRVFFLGFYFFFWMAEFLGRKAEIEGEGTKQGRAP